MEQRFMGQNGKIVLAGHKHVMRQLGCLKEENDNNITRQSNGEIGRFEEAQLIR